MFTTVSEVSEADLLKRIFPRLPRASGALLGPGDDASVVAVPDGRVVISIDTLVEEKDFRLERPNGHITTGYDVGWKSAAQNLSDINAMGGRATTMVVSLTLPGQTEVQWVEQLADGLCAAIVDLGADGCGVVGGDLGGGREIVVTAAITGSLDGGEPILRAGAQVGDVVGLAGTVGFAGAGLALMESDHPAQSLDPHFLKFVEIQKRPRPPLQAGPAAARAGATSMLDVSDGLLRDVGRLAQVSSVRIELDQYALNQLAEPLREVGKLLCVDPMEWALGGGEDYSLLATFSPAVTLPEGFTAVGSVCAGLPGVTIGTQSPAIMGWDHFEGKNYR
ncbi:thiamine-phosphate kinase [Arthrobacter sp. Bz4]|uniref:thiamine-phosphate kinase n=1 Tax=Arthrobacter sp. Bz4 TaxID=2171979 RepID=UPI000D517484|nr:thiamine-phosphate kinase [Arthrobacter sp. Bz4]PVE15865.1 thiamine-phosphate kinase [Arthrobacter sp. Bz4]